MGSAPPIATQRAPSSKRRNGRRGVSESVLLRPGDHKAATQSPRGNMGSVDASHPFQ
jgi:hypothetical protein